MKKILTKFQKDTNSIVWLAVVISLLFHAVIFSIKLNLSHDISHHPKNKYKKIKVVLRKDPPQEKKKLLKEKSKKKQIVNNEETGLKEIPKESKFLSKSNQKYLRETTAKTIASFKEAGKGLKDGAKSSQKVVRQKQRRNKKEKVVKKVKQTKGKKKIVLSDLNLANNNLQVEKYSPQKTESAPKGLENGNNKKVGLSQNNDFIEDLPLGDFTNLNTTEFKYYGFFHRIRQQLEQHWGNSLREKVKILFKQGRRLASENKITSLKVTLDDKGNILKVYLKGTSGIQELDDAAIESFNKAGPFPNPPKGMIKNGMAVIEWGFVVKG